MRAKEIREICIDSAEKYYNFVDNNEKSVIEIQILSKRNLIESNRIWELKLFSKLYSVDNIIIINRKDDMTWDLSNFNIRSYDANNNVIIIEFKESSITFSDSDPKDLRVINDLKYLILNVKKWYENHGNKLRLPEKKIKHMISDKTDKAVDKLILTNRTQNLAINCILNNELTYVWGPPGTGKTKHVLSKSILKMIKFINKPVCVLAPTNHSLDLIMRSVIDVAKKINIDENKFLRVGTPTREFAESYPSVCENNKITKNIIDLKRQKKIYEKAINYFDNGNETCKSLENIFKDIKRELRFNEGLVLSKKRYVKRIENLNNEKKSLFQSLIDKLMFKEPEIDKQITFIKTEINNLSKEIEISNKKMRTKIKLLKRHRIYKNVINLKNLDIEESEVKEIVKYILKNKEKFLKTFKIDLEIIENYSNYSVNDLERELSRICKKIKLLQEGNLKEKLKNIKVVGFTIDTYIGRTINDFVDFSHIFLDEAAYTPLVKALTLFVYKTPVTFLGDHKQLAPICLMDEKNIEFSENKNVILWLKSAIMVENIFMKCKKGIYDTLFKQNVSHLDKINKVNLTETYRFSHEMSDILNRNIYKNGFKTALEMNRKKFEIYVIDSKNNEKTNERKNPAEVNSIKELLRTYNFKNYVILTPYKAQISLLNSKIREIRRQNKALTIHKSQSREWEEVIFSVVDSNKTKVPWFTDSLNCKSRGDLVLNTAISRVKEKLFIVCDKHYWLNRNDSSQQLLSQIIRKAKEIHFE